MTRRPPGGGSRDRAPRDSARPPGALRRAVSDLPSRSGSGLRSVPLVRAPTAWPEPARRRSRVRRRVAGLQRSPLPDLPRDRRHGRGRLRPGRRRPHHSAPPGPQGAAGARHRHRRPAVCAVVGTAPRARFAAPDRRQPPRGHAGDPRRRRDAWTGPGRRRGRRASPPASGRGGDPADRRRHDAGRRRLVDRRCQPPRLVWRDPARARAPFRRPPGHGHHPGSRGNAPPAGGPPGPGGLAAPRRRRVRDRVRDGGADRDRGAGGRAAPPPPRAGSESPPAARRRR